MNDDSFFNRNKIFQGKYLGSIRLLGSCTFKACGVFFFCLNISNRISKPLTLKFKNGLYKSNNNEVLNPLLLR